MNRAQRRADLRSFRRDVHRDHIDTHLVDVNADLDGFPVLSRAAAYWRNGIPTRKPYCIACRSSFAETAEAGAFLFATPPGAADIASVSIATWVTARSRRFARVCCKSSGPTATSSTRGDA